MNDRQTSEEIGSDEVRAALDRVMRSETFARAERARALLAYIVETEQNGDASRLKGFTIAQDVFGKDDDFDPAMDAVVRVQAGRLREHLAAFYDGEGRDAPVQITVPKGTYVPSYVRREVVSETGASGNSAGVARIKDEKPLRDVDFGAGETPFALDAADEATGESAARQLSSKTPADDEPILAPVVIRNIQRFWLALAIILLLLTVILFLVWRP